MLPFDETETEFSTVYFTKNGRNRNPQRSLRICPFKCHRFGVFLLLLLLAQFDGFTGQNTSLFFKYEI